jgi:hypothetical protein
MSLLPSAGLLRHSGPCPVRAPAWPGSSQSWRLTHAGTLVRVPGLLEPESGWATKPGQVPAAHPAGGWGGGACDLCGPGHSCAGDAGLSQSQLAPRASSAHSFSFYLSLPGSIALNHILQTKSSNLPNPWEGEWWDSNPGLHLRFVLPDSTWQLTQLICTR